MLRFYFYARSLRLGLKNPDGLIDNDIMCYFSTANLKELIDHGEFKE